jgi:hypothetical protein
VDEHELQQVASTLNIIKQSSAKFEHGMFYIEIMRSANRFTMSISQDILPKYHLGIIQYLLGTVLGYAAGISWYRMDRLDITKVYIGYRPHITLAWHRYQLDS